MLKDKFIKFLKLEGLIDNLTGYIETRVELLKLEVKEDLARGLASVLIALVISVALIFFLLFISMAIAYLIGTAIGMTAGFALVGSVYFLTALLLILQRKELGKKIEMKLLEIIKKKEK